jgi:hypothetical protein
MRALSDFDMTSGLSMPDTDAWPAERQAFSRLWAGHQRRNVDGSHQTLPMPLTTSKTPRPPTTTEGMAWRRALIQ